MAAPSKYAARRFLIGLVALAVIAMIMVVAVTANQARLPWTEPTRIRAAFENIGQLAPGSEVRQNGLKIGQVAAVDLADGKPVVTMEVTGGVPMHRDGYAGIWDQSSLAQKFVELRPGTEASGLLGDAVLPASQTESTHDLVDVLDVFDKPTRDALGNALRQIGGGMLMGDYGPGFHGFLASLPTSEDSVRKLSVTLVSDRTDLPGLLRSTDRVSSRFTGREQILGELLRQTDETLRAIGTDDGKALGATLAKAPNTLRTARGALDDARPVLADLTAGTRDLTPGADALGRSTDDLRGTFREAQEPFHGVPDFADEAKPAVSNLKDTFSDLRPFVPRLGGGLKDAAVPLQYMKPYALDIGSFFTDVGSLIVSHEGWTHHFRGALAMPTATSLTDLPIRDSALPYPKPRQNLLIRDKDGAFIPGDVLGEGGKKAGGK